MKCILMGHTPKTVEGTGKYAGQSFTMCAECGNPMNDDVRRYPGYQDYETGTPAPGREARAGR